MSLANEYLVLGENLSDEEEEEQEQEQDQDQETHPLFDSWGLWYHSHQSFNKTDTASSSSEKDQQNWFSDLKQFGSVSSVEEFWSFHHFMVPPSELELNCNYHFFREGIRPEWEDPKNKGGGRWVIFVKQDRLNLDVYWDNIVLALCGEFLKFSSFVNGAVLNRRKHMDKISIWTAGGMGEEAVEELGREIRELVGDQTTRMRQSGFKMEYSLHPRG